MAKRWSPWVELRALDVLFSVERLPDSLGGAVVFEHKGRTFLMLDERLSQVERRCLLAHELVHIERGGGCRGAHTDIWAPVIAREERIVDQIVAERLMPPAEVAEWLGRQWGVTIEDVCEEWRVTPHIARIGIKVAKTRRRRAA